MTKKLKLLFDECVGKPVMESIPGLLHFSKHEFELAHILDKQKQGIWDETWIPQIASEGWIVITGDRGKGTKKKGEKLPLVCEQHGITYVMFGPSLHHATNFDKITAVVHVWDELAKLTEAPPGSAYLLSRTQSGNIKLTAKAPRRSKHKTPRQKPTPNPKPRNSK